MEEVGLLQRQQLLGVEGLQPLGHSLVHLPFLVAAALLLFDPAEHAGCWSPTSPFRCFLPVGLEAQGRVSSCCSSQCLLLLLLLLLLHSGSSVFSWVGCGGPLMMWLPAGTALRDVTCSPPKDKGGGSVSAAVTSGH